MLVCEVCLFKWKYACEMEGSTSREVLKITSYVCGQAVTSAWGRLGLAERV